VILRWALEPHVQGTCGRQRRSQRATIRCGRDQYTRRDAAIYRDTSDRHCKAIVVTNLDLALHEVCGSNGGGS
jgi:hypothetical protein